MSDAALEPLRYPIGRWDPTAGPSAGRPALIDSIAAAPGRLRAAIDGLRDEQLDTPYREGGWTVRQVVHHVPDSHLNAYVRFKWTLTEDSPRIKTYDEAAWARLPDSRLTPIATSLALLDALHLRWVTLLHAMDDTDFARTFEHPDWGALSLDAMLSLYEWHGRHHAAHVTSLRERMGW